MNVLVTGAAGFIGFHMVQQLLARHCTVIGIDNMNAYYDVSLKEQRLKRLEERAGFSFVKVDITDAEAMTAFFEQHPDIEVVIHLAAQAGVRYSLEAPLQYAQSNVVGHLNVLEGCRHLKKLRHFIYASSSSVYGATPTLPFKVEDRTDSPLSLYAATKKSGELMSASYSHLFHIPTTGLRYFTVYGPWGRPDMAAFLFTRSILEGKEIDVFNHGDMKRNYTYVDDIVNGTIACIDHAPQAYPHHQIYNLGHHKSEKLMDFIRILEKLLDKPAKLRMTDKHPGDVKETLADIAPAMRAFDYNPQINLETGLAHFVSWYQHYYAYKSKLTT